MRVKCAPTSVQEQTYSFEHKAPLAVFDFDGTLINGQSGTLFTLYLFRHHLLSCVDMLHLTWWAARYVLHLPFNQAQAREILFKKLAGRSKQDVTRLMKDFHERIIMPRYRARGIKEVHQKQSEGCIIVLVSATFKGIAEQAALYLGIDHVIATDMRYDEQQRYTGFVYGDVVEGAAKEQELTKWAQKTFGADAWYIDFAYGDHHTDDALLQKAVHPVAINPGIVLKYKARRNKWRIENWKRA